MIFHLLGITVLNVWILLLTAGCKLSHKGFYLALIRIWSKSADGNLILRPLLEIIY